jgi:hypothetical protein
LISRTFALPILLNGQILSDPLRPICQLSLLDWRGLVYVALWIYLVPLFLLFLIYWKIIYHIHRTTVAARKNLSKRRRLHKEIRTLIRIAVPVLTLFILGSPYIVFFLYTQATRSIPPFSYHISAIFLPMCQGVVTFTSLFLTQSVRMHWTKQFCQTTRVEPFVTFNRDKPPL